tara:strand:+ start:4710 stop:5006 length:297 start_codon:yes stop_codon:yes gene_type:complete
MSFLDKMKQAKDLYGNMKKIQEEISKIRCYGASKNGKVNVTVNGSHALEKLELDESLQGAELSKSIIEACNDAHHKVDKEIKTRMGGMMNTGGMKLPF